MSIVYYRGCLLKGVSFIVELYNRRSLFRGCILQWVSIRGVSFEGVSFIGVFIKGFSVIWVSDLECLL